MSVFSLLQRGAQRNDGRPFLVTERGEVTYPRALELATNIAHGLVSRGFVRGDPVSYTHLTLPTNREV